MALTSWNDILNKPKGVDNVEELALTVEQLSASVLSISEDVGELALDVSQLSASVISITEDISEYSDKKFVTAGENITVDKGGYINIGKSVIVTLKLITSSAIAANSILVSGLPSALYSVYINCGNGYNSNAYGCRVEDGKIIANETIPTTTTLNISFSYIIV